jgi:hypothetical protein
LKNEEEMGILIRNFLKADLCNSFKIPFNY